MGLDHLILGGGIAGLATAWNLAREGRERILVVEREPTLGSMASAQNAAILRTFGPDPVTTEIARRSAGFLRRPPPGFAPVPLVDPVGLLLVASGAAAEDLGQGVANGGRALSAEEVRRSFPHLGDSADRAELRLLFEDEGRLDVAALVDAFAAGARRAGVEIRTQAEVARLAVESGRVVGAVLTGGEELRARTTTLAAGAWADRLGAAAGSRVELRPTRRHLLVTGHDTAVDPRWGVVWFEEGGFYARPESGGLLLSGCDLTDVDPDTAGADPDVRALIAEKAARYLSGFDDARAAHFWHGFRTLTADDRFCVGHDPDLAGLFWVAGLGGHGMTAGAEVGRLAAGWLAGSEREARLRAALDPRRLARAAERLSTARA